jgi:hypothetical protein
MAKNASAARSPTAASITNQTPVTNRTAGSKPPTTVPTKPSNRSLISLPPSLIVHLFLSTILQASVQIPKYRYVAVGFAALGEIW